MVMSFPQFITNAAILDLMDSSEHIAVVSGSSTKKLNIKDIPNGSYIDPHVYGAKGDAIAAVDGALTGTQLSSATYQFTADDVGKLCFINENERTIASVSGGVATLSSAVYNGTNFRWLMGTDDTLAIEAAMVAAKTIGVDFASGSVSESGRWGSIPFGGTVHLRAGHGYLVRNTQARYDAGKQGAISVPRRCSLKGGGIAQTHIYLAPGNIGHGVCNANSGVNGGGWDDFMTLADFSLFGNHDLQPAGCLDGIHFNAAFNNYLKVDNFMFMQNIRVFEPKRNGFYISGRGEGVYLNLFVYSAFNHGFHITGHMDSRFAYCNAGGCQKTGFYIEKSANDHFTNCKSFYNGAGGGTDMKECANFALVADSYLNGQVVMTSCESQEARGSGFYIASGLNQLTSCLSADAGRVPIGGDPRPAVMAGFHIAQVNTAHQNAKHNMFIDCVVRPSLTLDYNNANNPAVYAGTHAVYIDDYCLGNKGNIWTFENAAYTVAKTGGTGTTNGKNTGLKVDSVALFSAATPDQVTGLVATALDSSVSLVWSKPYHNGSPITDYVVEYKLTSEPTTWTTFSDGTSTVLSATVTGLTNGSSYDFRVKAVNAIGNGAVSATSTVTPFVSAPAQVTGLTATANMLSTDLSWTAPANNNSPITDYTVEYKLTSEPTTWTTFAHTASTATTITVIGLTQGLAYDFRVKAVNAIGTGTASATSSATPIAFNPTTWGVTLWLDASDTSKVSLSGSNLSTITDKSSNADVITPSGTPWVTTTANSKQALTMTAGNVLPLPSRMLTVPQGNSTVLACVKAALDWESTVVLGSVGANYSLQLNGGSNRIEARHHASTVAMLNLSPADDTNIHMVGMRRNGTDIRIYYSSQTGAHTTAGQNTSPTAINVGGNIGVFCELLIFPSSLTDSQVEIVKGYYASKWAAL